jgi:hypothetical protein
MSLAGEEGVLLLRVMCKREGVPGGHEIESG